jgi:pimeloyl-ACP methyl ester carboxylesterase
MPVLVVPMIFGRKPETRRNYHKRSFHNCLSVRSWTVSSQFLVAGDRCAPLGLWGACSGSTSLVRARYARPVLTESDLELGDGRRLHVYDSGDGRDARRTVFWHHGTPNLGAPPEPLFPAAARLGIRWLSYDRPGYGRSTSQPGRDLAAAADEVAGVADALGIGQFGVMGHSGGSNHALACGALLGERVLGVVCMAGLAPFHTEGLDWFGGMAASGAARLRAAARGRAALEDYLASAEFDPEEFTPADHAALAGAWSWLGEVAGQAQEGGLPGGMVDDELAYVAPWGFAPGQVRAPVLLLHGGQDRIVPSAHARWLASRIPSAELWLRPEEGHISVLHSAEAALGWLGEHGSQG